MPEKAARPQPGAFSALMRWRDGAQGVFLCNNNAGSRREEYVFHAPDETCSVTGTGLTIERNGHPSTTAGACRCKATGMRPNMTPFLHAIRSGVEPPHSLAAIAPSLFLAELIEDGFSGRVQLPQTRASCRSAAAAAGGKSILVVPVLRIAGTARELASALPVRVSARTFASRRRAPRYCRGYFGPRLIRAARGCFGQASAACRCRHRGPVARAS